MKNITILTFLLLGISCNEMKPSDQRENVKKADVIEEEKVNNLPSKNISAPRYFTPSSYSVDNCGDQSPSFSEEEIKELTYKYPDDYLRANNSTCSDNPQYFGGDTLDLVLFRSNYFEEFGKNFVYHYLIKKANTYSWQVADLKLKGLMRKTCLFDVEEDFVSMSFEFKMKDSTDFLLGSIYSDTMVFDSPALLKGDSVVIGPLTRSEDYGKVGYKKIETFKIPLEGYGFLIHENHFITEADPKDYGTTELPDTIHTYSRIDWVTENGDTAMTETESLSFDWFGYSKSILSPILYLGVLPSFGDGPTILFESQTGGSIFTLSKDGETNETELFPRWRRCD